MPTPPPWWTDTHEAPRRGREERVQDRPVGDRVGAVHHRLGLAERRGDRAGIEVVAADHDRRRHLAAADELVEDQARLRPVALAEPADPGRQPLELDPVGRELEPPLQQRVVGEGLAQRLVDAVDVGGVARQRRPAERPGAAAEERPHVGRHEAGEVERVARARRRAPRCAGCCRSRRCGCRPPAGRASPARAGQRCGAPRRRSSSGSRSRSSQRVGERHLVRHVAVQHVVGRGLVGDQVEAQPRARRARRTRRPRSPRARPTRRGRRRRARARARRRRPDPSASSSR